MSNDLPLADGSVWLRPDKYDPQVEGRTEQRTINVHDGFDEALAIISGVNGMDPQQALDLMVEFLVVETLAAIALAEVEAVPEDKPHIWWDEPELPFGD